MKKIVVTGAGGFVGKRLIALSRERYKITPLSLRSTDIGSLDLRGVDTVIHLAGKAHDMGPVPDAVYFAVNYELTRQLADRAMQEGVGHFVYISSSKVYGDSADGLLDESSLCTPSDAYGASKLKAEQYLQSLETARFKIAILRPPVVYGPEVKGNIIRLLRLAEKKYPLPLGDTRNARSLVFVDNLVALVNSITDQEASGVFIAGDSEPLSTDTLVKLMRKHLGNASSLVSIPPLFRRLFKKLRPGLYSRLFGSFVVDNSHTNAQLNFVPPYSTEEGVKEMVEWFRGSDK